MDRMAAATDHRYREARPRLARTVVMDKQRARLRRRGEYAALGQHHAQGPGFIGLVRRGGKDGLAMVASRGQIEAPLRGGGASMAVQTSRGPPGTKGSPRRLVRRGLPTVALSGDQHNPNHRQAHAIKPATGNPSR